jgi:hypothetical protein
MQILSGVGAPLSAPTAVDYLVVRRWWWRVARWLVSNFGGGGGGAGGLRSTL